ncbi:MAG: FIST C-terminal domain-containing protein [Elusimicrobia bacterium]|jgi:small ligand-binding sensory domain FIST|nr:FIST C-terminal domain-containing protein [Elusimicrobiota bacterium]
MKWASALSAESRLETAVKEAALSVKKQLDGAVPDFMALFVSRNFADRYEEAGALLADRLPGRVVMGTSAAGLIGEGKELESKPGVSLTAAVLPDVKVHAFSIQEEDLPDLDDSPRAWEKLVGVRATENPQFVLLADPFSFRIDNFILGLDFAFPKSAKVGGLASGGSEPGRNALYLNHLCLRSGLVGVALTGNIALETVVAQGCRPIGLPLRVTECNENILISVNGKPPVEVLQSIFPDLPDRDRRLMKQALFVGIAMTSTLDHPAQGDFLIRNILGVNNENGSLAIGSPLRPGQTIQFHLRDSHSSTEDLRAVFDRTGEAKTKTRGALLFSCVGRGKSLFGKANHDTDFFLQNVGPVPLGGFFCNGEIGPVGGTTYVHGYTSCFGLFQPCHE